MSNFLIEDTSKSFKDRVVDILGQALSDPLNPILDPLRSSIPGYLEVNPPTLPISQITGFVQFNPNTTSASAAVTSTSLTYSAVISGDTDGTPSLSNIPDGNYMIMLGNRSYPGVTTDLVYHSLSINGAAVSDDDAVVSTGTNFGISVMMVVFKELSNKGSNTIQSQYRVSAGTGNWSNRWLAAIKYKNL